MDGSRFEDLAKSLTAQRSRRGVLGALAGAALASIGLGHASAAAKRAAGNSCNTNADCASNFCVQETRTRKICYCRSNADCPAVKGQCQTAACLPSGYCAAAVTPGAACDDNDRCTTGDICQSDGSCAGTPITCQPIDECHDAGTCQPADGQCSAGVYRGDGAACSTGVCWNQACCTPEDQSITCAGGLCGSQINNCGQPVDCGACCTPVDGGWSGWSPCSFGVQSRTCDNPPPACGGSTCAGSSDQACCGDFGAECGQDGDCCSSVCVNGVCQGGPVADGGACDNDSDCLSGTCCGNVCVDLSANGANCGGCGLVCSAGTTCQNGSCAPTGIPGQLCGSDADCGGLTCCDGECADTMIDASNCGTCGNFCILPNATATCVAGACAVAFCKPGWGDCDGNPANGCETNLNTNVANCGSCNHVCSIGDICDSGLCLGV